MTHMKTLFSAKRWLVHSWMVAGMVGMGCRPPAPVEIAPQAAAGTNPVSEAQALLAERARLDAGLWRNESEAQEHERPFTTLWDDLRRSTNRWATLAGFTFESLRLGEPGPVRRLPHEVRRHVFGSPNRPLPPAEVRQMLARWEADGIRLEHSEWHHKQFHPGEPGKVRSTFSATLYAVRDRDQTRFLVQTEFDVLWAAARDPGKPPVVREIVVNQLTLSERGGADAFRKIGLPRKSSLSPVTLIARDLTGDGRSEILIPTENLAYSYQGDGTWQPYLLMKQFPLHDIETDLRWVRSVLADFTGDAKPDLMLAVPGHGVLLYEADAKGFFTGTPVKLLEEAKLLEKPSVLTVGDVNLDGRLDVWLGQYLPAYVGGQMPAPFYDANDGPPAFLLLNEGAGKFRDATVASGLAGKRNRRVFSASFVDWDDDGDLDLLVVSDFSGLDIFENDGKGTFQDVTDRLADERANFGMSHVLDDLDRDGKLDLFVTGMASTTARRLVALGLSREEFPEHNAMRLWMAFGNRLYLGDGRGRFRQPAAAGMVNRSGWSWGSAALDFANDGWPDLYVANGHISGRTTRDYCTTYWRHDIYVDSRTNNPVLARLFQRELGVLGDISWNGYEKNVLFVNDGGTNFVSAGYLFDVAFEFDSRSVLVDDFDHDGRMDLVVVQQDFFVQPPDGFTVHVLRNEWTNTNHWIGVLLAESPGVSPYGARVEVRTASGKHTGWVVSGDSLWVQHAPMRHFGLGAEREIRSITVTWPGGKRTVLEKPEPDRYHRVAAP